MKRILGFCIACLLGVSANAQTDSLTKPQKNPRLCEIKMRDGSSYKGKIETQSDSVIFLKSSVGVVVFIPKHNVSSIDFVNGKVSHDTTGKLGMQFHLNSIANRYNFTSANAFLFNKGEIYGSNSYFVFGNINYAFNRNFSLGISSSAIGSPMGMILRSNFELSPKLFIGLEGRASSLTYINSKTFGSEGILKMTFGDERASYTFYGGFFDFEDWILPKRRRARRGTPAVIIPGNYYLILNSPFIGAGFSTKISQHAHFVADASYYPNMYGYTAAIGLRSAGKQKISWVGGFQTIKATVPTINPALNILNRGLIFPYLGFSYRL